MRKRFLQVCKNPICQKEFGILYANIEDGGTRIRCPHCSKLQKVVIKKRR